MRLAHVSDLHVPSRWPRAPWLYLGKRAIGAFNYKVRRARFYPETSIRALAAELAGDRSLDHVVVTGDLTNVSFPEEFAAARAFLEPVIARGPGFVSVIPGNHDRYTYSSDRRRYFERHFADCATSDLDLGAPFPFVRFRGDPRGEVAILGLDSAVATPPFLATGRVGERQRRLLEEALDHPRVRAASFRLALVHHPPRVADGGRDGWHHRLRDDRELYEVARAKGVNLLLHGHVHRPFTVAGPVPGIGAGSSTVAHPLADRAGGINVYEIANGQFAHVETRVFDPATGRYSRRR